ncbi:hypothetical protein, partial [Effusibacillus pohliae]|uniref:hypothetical protein n=1 Tax=Effusibacillus pohliae TaxID=232270 RepID=UPI000478147C
AVLLAVAADLTVWWRGGVPVMNHIYRIVSGAPNVHLNGTTLLYSGTFKESKFAPYKRSDEGVQLYKAAGIPEGVTRHWIFIPRDDKPAYRYKFPEYGIGF